MKKIFAAAAFAISPFIFLFACIICLLFYHTSFIESRPVHTTVYAALPTSQNIFSATINADDGRVARIQAFLTQYGSPLADYAQDIVTAADQYGIDFRLVPAIAMQESNLCRKAPVGSYNCWGFGIYGKTVTRFSDYKTAIYTVSKALGTKYKSRGLVTPNQIMTMYTPSSNGSWAYSVNHFMDVLQ